MLDMLVEYLWRVANCALCQLWRLVVEWKRDGTDAAMQVSKTLSSHFPILIEYGANAGRGMSFTSSLALPPDHREFFLSTPFH
jgi:hypothetical protein